MFVKGPKDDVYNIETTKEAFLKVALKKQAFSPDDVHRPLTDDPPSLSTQMEANHLIQQKKPVKKPNALPPGGEEIMDATDGELTDRVRPDLGPPEQGIGKVLQNPDTLGKEPKTMENDLDNKPQNPANSNFYQRIMQDRERGWNPLPNIGVTRQKLDNRGPQISRKNKGKK